MLKDMYSLFQRTKRTILKRIFWSPNERQSGKNMSALLTFDCMALPKHSQFFIDSSESISKFSLAFQKYYLFLIGSPENIPTYFSCSSTEYCLFFLSLALSRSTASSLALQKFGRLFIGCFFLNFLCSHMVPRSAKRFKL